MKRITVFLQVFLIVLTAQDLCTQTTDSDTVWTHYTYPESINAVKFTPDGKYLASGGTDSIPRLWDAETGELEREFPKQNEIQGISIANNMIAFYGFNEGGVRVYDLENYELLATFKGSYSGEFTNDGKYFINGRIENGAGLSIYETNSWEIINSIELENQTIAIAISPDNKLIASSGSWSNIPFNKHNGEIRIHRFSDLTKIITLENEEFFGCDDLCFSPDGNYVAAAIMSSKNKIWNTSDWNLYREIGGNSDSRAIAFSPDNNYVVIGTGGFQNWHLSIFDNFTGIETNNYRLDWLAKKFLNLDEGDTPRSIAIATDRNKIAVGGVAGIYMLNAKWNSTSVQEDIIHIMETEIYPNPGTDLINIDFELMEQANTNISIYDSIGNQIENLFEGILIQGVHHFEWNANVPSGVYYAQITANNYVETINIIIEN